jgi:preprotein translocase subunit YajC
MINRKAQTFMAEQTLGILIAALCILFLVSFLAMFFISASQTEKTKQAEGILNGEEGIIVKINSGETYSDFKLLSPGGRYLFGFTESKPNSCVGENCLCICEKTNAFDKLLDKNTQIKKCDKSGICSKVPNLAESFEIKIEKGGKTSISITQINGLVEIRKN